MGEVGTGEVGFDKLPRTFKVCIIILSIPFSISISPGRTKISIYQLILSQNVSSILFHFIIIKGRNSFFIITLEEGQRLFFESILKRDNKNWPAQPFKNQSEIQK